MTSAHRKKIYTKYGDSGETSLLYGGRVSKNGPHTEAYGVTDEAVSTLGLARALSQDDRVKDILRDLQKELFLVAAELATDPKEYETFKRHFSPITHEMVTQKEDLIDQLEEEAEMPKGTITSRSLVQYTHPFDIRYSGYLILSRLDTVNDQFVSLSSQRRVKRVNLRGEAVFGTDFSFEDILPRQIGDAKYTRLADEPANGSDCFVIEAIPNHHARSEYSLLRVYVDKQRYVPLVTRYWDDRQVEVKELRADPSQIEKIEGVWVPKHLTMRHLRLESYTTLQLQELEANPPLTKTTFELRRLESH